MLRIKNMIRDHGGGIPVGILRFIILVPFGIYSAISRNHWDVIKNNAELHSGLYGFAIVNGERFAKKWAEFGFYWNFAVWIPAIIVPAPFSMVFGIVDIAIAVLLSLATHKQTGYSPHNMDKCGGTGAHYWMLPPGANESFFEASARLNATATNSFQMCKSFVLEWRYGIVVSVFYCLIAIINIVVCCSACMLQFDRSKRENKSFRRWILDAVIAVPKFFGILVISLLYLIPMTIFQCLPMSFKSRVRYARQYTVKSCLAVINAGGVKLGKLKTKTMHNRAVKKRYQGRLDGQPTPLADFLGIYDMLMLVVADLHYPDIVNLSLASKSVREAVLPAEDYERRLQHFRMYSCDPETKQQCWVCTNQICSVNMMDNGNHICARKCNIPQTVSLWHLDQCKAYCTPCYKAFIRTKHSADPPICSCAPITATPNIFQRLLKGSHFYANGQHLLKHISKPICRQCSYLRSGKLEENRRKRTKYELKIGNEDNPCAKCNGLLGTGPRWWICANCQLECTSSCHRAWGKKAKSEDIAVGDEAV